jgi:dTDP-4-dehydrorhamnose 3,5-epimerase
MAFRTVERFLDGVMLIETDRYGDERGYFEEVTRHDALAALGVEGTFVQTNHSRSVRGVIRGLHYQHDAPMGKLLICLRGEIQVVEVDLRAASPTFGQHITLTLSESEPRLLWVPPGFANGFCVVSNEADVLYACTATYNASGEGGVHPLDPTLGIAWSTDAPLLSAKDAAAPTFNDYAASPKF